MQGGDKSAVGDVVQGEIVLKGWHVCLGVEGWIGVDEEPNWVLVLTSTAFYKLRVSNVTAQLRLVQRHLTFSSRRASFPLPLSSTPTCRTCWSAAASPWAM